MCPKFQKKTSRRNRDDMTVVAHARLVERLHSGTIHPIGLDTVDLTHRVGSTVDLFERALRLVRARNHRPYD